MGHQDMLLREDEGILNKKLFLRLDGKIQYQVKS